jgi:hypothetical protein
MQVSTIRVGKHRDLCTNPRSLLRQTTTTHAMPYAVVSVERPAGGSLPGRHSRERKNAHFRSWAHENLIEPMGLAKAAILVSA